MNEESERPLSMLVTQILLLLATLVFLILMVIDLTAGGAVNSFVQVAMYFLLFVMLPATALIGLLKRWAWGPGLAILSIGTIWAFALKVAWSFFVSPGELLERVVGLVQLPSMIFFLLLTVLFGLPLLLIKLRFGSSESKYLSASNADPEYLTPGHPDYIGDAIPGLDESFVDR